MTDSRAVSAVLGYVLTLGIVTLLIGGLFMAAGDFVEDQHERAIRAELEVVGNRLAADVSAVDRLGLAAGTGGKAQLRTDLPARAAGQPYQIEISPAGGAGVHYLNLSTTNPDVAVEVKVRTESTLASDTVNGGSVVVVYDSGGLEVRDG